MPTKCLLAQELNPSLLPSFTFTFILHFIFYSSYRLFTRLIYRVLFSSKLEIGDDHPTIKDRDFKLWDKADIIATIIMHIKYKAWAIVINFL